MMEDLRAGLARLPSDRGCRWEPYRPFPDVARRNWNQQYLEIPAMVRALGLGRGLRVLEVGCGRGCALPVLAKLLAPARLVGLDISEPFLVEARRAVREAGICAELVHGDVRDIPLPGEAFDLVIDFGTCYHIAYAARALDEIIRVLVPGGLFVCETPIAQVLSHPVRSLGRGVPWHLAPLLERDRWRLLWSSRRKSAASPGGAVGTPLDGWTTAGGDGR